MTQGDKELLMTPSLEQAKHEAEVLEGACDELMVLAGTMLSVYGGYALAVFIRKVL